MKILFYRYGSICEPDIIEAMKHLGHEVFCINLEITDKIFPHRQSSSMFLIHCYHLPSTAFSQ